MCESITYSLRRHFDWPISRRKRPSVSITAPKGRNGSMHTVRVSSYLPERRDGIVRRSAATKSPSRGVGIVLSNGGSATISGRCITLHLSSGSRREVSGRHVGSQLLARMTLADVSDTRVSGCVP